MYCEESPCGCNKVKPVRKPVKRVIAAPVEVKASLSSVKAIRPTEDVEFETALTVLAEAGMLHPDELVTHRKSIKLTDEKIKILVWKFRYWEARRNETA